MDGKTDPDDIPETPKNPVTRTGNLWVLGKHRIVCGDSTDQKTVERLLDGAEPDLMVTDPPYGVNYDAHLAVQGRVQHQGWRVREVGQRRHLRLAGRVRALPRFNRLRLDERPRPSGGGQRARRLRLHPARAHHLGTRGTSSSAEGTTTGDTSRAGTPSRRARRPTGRATGKPRPSGRSTTPGNLKPATRRGRRNYRPGTACRFGCSSGGGSRRSSTVSDVNVL